MRTLFLFFCLLFVSGTASAQGFKAYQWRKDIAFLEKELPQRHKDFFRHYPEPDFRLALDSLREALPGLEDWEVVLRLQEIICRAGDSHTAITSEGLRNGPAYPLDFHWFEEGLFVMGATTVASLDTLLGKKLLAVNGIAVDEIAARAARLMVVDNASILRLRLPRLISSSYTLRYIGVVEGSSAVFTFRNADGFTFNLPIETVPARSVESAFATFQPEAYAFTERDNRKPFWHEYLETEQILYIRYNRCTSREVETKYGNRKKARQLPSFEKFSQEVLAVLETRPVKKLVFDVSNNPGGSSQQGTALAEKIGQAYHGDVFVVIGKRTYSSAVLNTLDFQQYCRATLVGEPTSGRPNHFGEVRKFRLPYSGATVMYSTKYFQKVDGDPVAIEPDIPIELSFSDFQRGIDPAREYIKGL